MVDLQGDEVPCETNRVSMRVDDPASDARNHIEVTTSISCLAIRLEQKASLSPLWRPSCFTKTRKAFRTRRRRSPPAAALERKKKEKRNNAFVAVNSSYTAVTCAALHECQQTHLWVFEEQTSSTAEEVSFFHTTFVVAAVALTQLFFVGIQIKEDGMCVCVKGEKKNTTKQ